MPSTIRSLLAAAELPEMDVVPWGMAPHVDAPGVYLVSLSPTVDAHNTMQMCPISMPAVERLLAVRPELLLDIQRPTVDQLASRLASLWLPEETVLYVGLAGTSISKRVTEYYRTPLGARAPHAGGWPLKTLEILPSLHVHYVATDDVDQVEEQMVAAFVRNAQVMAAEGVVSDLPLPFANLRLPKGRAQRHGITGAREPRVARETVAPAIVREADPVLVPMSSDSTPGAGQFQLNVTAHDIDAGQIRVTREPKRRLDLPVDRTTVEIVLRGRRLQVPWDPRFGADQERSGLLRVGKAAATQLLRRPTIVTVHRGADGALHIE